MQSSTSPEIYAPVETRNNRAGRDMRPLALRLIGRGRGGAGPRRCGRRPGLREAGRAPTGTGAPSPATPLRRVARGERRTAGEA
jgi:hypothetical protein